MKTVYNKLTRKSHPDWASKNPYRIVNVQNSQTRCGRFPTLEAAIAHAATYRSGPIGVEGFDVLVSEMPCL